jgi:3-hydroxybutyryl-CoA dehydrogenase
VFEIVGIVGAGTMGVGVAEVVSRAGMRCIVYDIAPDALRRAESALRNSRRLSRLLGRDRAAESSPGCDATVSFTTDISELRPAQFVVENVTELVDVKARLYRQLDEICAPSVPIAANTSVLSISRLASYTRHPARIVGIHFMNPVAMRPMVEVIRGQSTSEETFALAARFLDSISKRFEVVADTPGFVSNRILMLTINEAIALVQSQVATAEQVDSIFRGCFAHPAGPLETADLIGLDTVKLSLDALAESLDDAKYRPSSLLTQLVADGRMGRKSGQGFYRYDLR